MFGATLALVLPAVAAGQSAPRLVMDINQLGAGTAPTDLTGVDGSLFFVANDYHHGSELWKSRGTLGETELVRDIRPGRGSSSPDFLTDVNGTLFFAADDGVHGVELWKSDGTEAGTVLVRDIRPGIAGSIAIPTGFVDVNGTLFFVADDGVHGLELWKSDGTEIGTVLVRDVHPGIQPSFEFNIFLVELNGTLVFDASGELWKSDGTESGTVRLSSDVLPSGSTGIPCCAVVNGALYFGGFDFSHGYELWKTDGTPSGTVLVRDIWPGFDSSISLPNSSSPDSFVEVNGTLFFAASDPTHGREVWKSDGTDAGTVLVRDIAPGTSPSYPGSLFDHNGTLFFVASADGFYGIGQLWKSDGTQGGTVLVSDIRPGIASTEQNLFTSVGETLYFAANDGTHGTELWKTDGTYAGTVLVRDIAYRDGAVRSIVYLGGKLYFVPFAEGLGSELWTSDGTPAGTVLVRDISPFNGPGVDLTSLIVMNETLFFAANDGRGFGLWNSDGTESGTDFVAPAAGTTPVNANGTLFFASSDSAHGLELWKSDGTEDGTALVRDIRPGTPGALSPFGNYLADVNGTVFFRADDGTHGQELWKSDGTETGTALVRDILAGTGNGIAAFGLGVQTVASVNGSLYFMANDGVHGTELWKSDGTETGTVLVRDIRQGAASSFPQYLMVAGGAIFFTADDGVNGPELWKSDGTEAGTVVVRDINPPGRFFAPEPLQFINGALLFSANDEVHGTELWRTDGTEAGTVRVRDIAPGTASSDPRAVGTANGTLYLRADDGVHGVELWKTDGTEAGTVFVRDIAPGSASSFPRFSAAVNGALFFQANDGAHGREIWKTDGTEAGTVLMGDIAPGAADSIPVALIRLVDLDGRLLFPADDGLHGIELWAIDWDSDDDGLSDEREHALGTDPFGSDSDHDRVGDREEVAAGSSPLDAGRYPVDFGIARIGDQENAADVTGFGAVDHDYFFSSHEVTVREYVSFLNAVADTDAFGLFADGSTAIQRSGSTGSYAYHAAPGREDTPVNLVSLYDAMRFANWLENGQPEGAQDSTTTEDGSYTITPEGITANSIARNPDSRFFLPTEDEWYKAAYYDAASHGYFAYPAHSASPIACATPGAASDTANCGGVVGDTVAVGSYTASASPSGGFDLGGNVSEWTEEINGADRRIRGGGFASPASELAAANSGVDADPLGEHPDVGFRLPEPSAVLQLVAGIGALASLARRRRAD